MQLQRLKAMAVFAAVVKTGSFNKAAALLQISRPAVSEQIRKLEDLLKVRVLQRSTRRLNVTPEGEKVLPLAQSVLDSLMMTEKVLLQDQLRGKIRLTATYDIAHNWLLPRITTFRQQYPHIEFDFLISDEKVDLIKNQIDLAIRVSSMDELGFVARKLFEDKLEVYASPNYLNRCAKPVTTESLLEHNWVVINQLTNGGEITLYNDSQKVRFSPEDYCSTNSPILSRDMILADMGLGLLIDNIAEPYIRSQQLVKVLPGWQAQHFSCYLLYPSKSYLPRRTQVLINFLLNSQN